MPKDFEPCEGGCTCGHVRYTVGNEPLIVHACHCRWCQRQTGGPHVINAIYESEFVQVSKGEVERIEVPTPSGEGQAIHRCPKCHDAIYSNYLVNGAGDRIRFLRAGTLDNPDLITPDVHIYTSTKVPWYVIPDDHYAVEEFYDMPTTWSKESLARLDRWREAAEYTRSADQLSLSATFMSLT